MICWRKGWDSNPRYRCRYDSFQDCFLRPLGHPSNRYRLYHTFWTVGHTVYTIFMRITQRKGDIAVTQAIASFTKLGYDVALPITESAAYDIIVDDSSGIYRVQVRYSGGVEVELRRIHTNSTGYVVKKTKADAYDWLYVLKPDGSEYLIKSCLSARRSIRPKPSDLLQNTIKG